MKRRAVYYDATRSAADPRNARRRKIGRHSARTKSPPITRMSSPPQCQKVFPSMSRSVISAAPIPSCTTNCSRCSVPEALRVSDSDVELRLTEIKARDARFSPALDLNDDTLRRVLGWVMRGLALIRSRSEFSNPAGACSPVRAAEARTRSRSCARTRVRSAWRDEYFSSRRGRIIADWRPCGARRAEDGAYCGDGGDRCESTRPSSLLDIGRARVRDAP